MYFTCKTCTKIHHMTEYWNGNCKWTALERHFSLLLKTHGALTRHVSASLTHIHALMAEAATRSAQQPISITADCVHAEQTALLHFHSLWVLKPKGRLHLWIDGVHGAGAKVYAKAMWEDASRDWRHTLAAHTTKEHWRSLRWDQFTADSCVKLKSNKNYGKQVTQNLTSASVYNFYIYSFSTTSGVRTLTLGTTDRLHPLVLFKCIYTPVALPSGE